MFCSKCSTRVQDGDYFCKNCGASLQAVGGVTQNAPMLPVQHRPSSPNMPRHPRQGGWGKNPYRDQIAQLRLQLKELRMQLREIQSQIAGTRSNYFEIDSFMQRGLFHDIGRMIEGTQLFSPYQQRKQLQEQILQLERQLLPLEQAQEQWRRQQQQNNEVYVQSDVI